MDIDVQIIRLEFCRLKKKQDAYADRAGNGSRLKSCTGRNSRSKQVRASGGGIPEHKPHKARTLNI